MKSVIRQNSFPSSPLRTVEQGCLADEISVVAPFNLFRSKQWGLCKALDLLRSQFFPCRQFNPCSIKASWQSLHSRYDKQSSGLNFAWSQQFGRELTTIFQIRISFQSVYLIQNYLIDWRAIPDKSCRDRYLRLAECIDQHALYRRVVLTTVVDSEQVESHQSPVPGSSESGDDAGNINEPIRETSIVTRQLAFKDEETIDQIGRKPEPIPITPQQSQHQRDQRPEDPESRQIQQIKMRNTNVV